MIGEHWCCQATRCGVRVWARQVRRHTNHLPHRTSPQSATNRPADPTSLCKRGKKSPIEMWRYRGLTDQEISPFCGTTRSLFFLPCQRSRIAGGRAWSRTIVHQADGQYRRSSRSPPSDRIVRVFHALRRRALAKVYYLPPYQTTAA